MRTTPSTPPPSASALRNFSDLGRGLAEMARVVRPGGRVVVLEITTPTRPPLSLFYRLWFDRLVPVLGRLTGALAARARAGVAPVGRDDRRRLRLPARARSSASRRPRRWPPRWSVRGWRDPLPAHRGGHRRDPCGHRRTRAVMMSPVGGTAPSAPPTVRALRTGRRRGDHAPRRQRPARADGPHRAAPRAGDRRGRRAAGLRTPPPRSWPGASACARCWSCSPPSPRAGPGEARRGERSGSCAPRWRSSSCTRRRSCTTT